MAEYNRMVAAFEDGAKKNREGYRFDKDDAGRYQDPWLQEAWEIFSLANFDEYNDGFFELEVKASSGNSDLLWRDISTAPKDRSEFLAFRADAGIFVARWDCEASFLSSMEIDALGMSDEDLHSEDWFCSDFVCGGRLEGDLAPTHWMPLPDEP